MFKSSKYTYRFLIGFFIVFLKNIFFAYKETSPIFNLASQIIDILVFWLLVPDVKNKLILISCAVLGQGYLYFFKDPIFKFDNENLIVRFFVTAFPFLIHIILSKNTRRVVIPILLGLSSWINLETAFHFNVNISLYNQVVNALPANMHLEIICISWVKAIFVISLVVIFYELNHQFFAWKSLRLYVEQTCNKRSIAIIYFIFKPLMYWFIGSLILVFLGQNRIPIFENKFSLIAYGLGFGSFLFIYAVYFRKFISIYFYENLGINNFLYICLALPFVDIFACIILLIFKNFQLKKWFHFKWPNINLVYSLILILMAYMAYYYVTILKNIPSSNTASMVWTYLAYFSIPLLIIVFLYLSKSNANRYRFLILSLMIMGFALQYFILPKIENTLDILLLVHMFLNYFLLLLSVFFIYPFLFLKNYLRIKD